MYTCQFRFFLYPEERLFVDQIRECCCAPSFVIAMAGPWFYILGAVFLSRVVIQPLTDFIPLTINLRIPLCTIAFFSSASEFLLISGPRPSDQRFFPCIRQFQSINGPIS